MAVISVGLNAEKAVFSCFTNGYPSPTVFQQLESDLSAWMDVVWPLEAEFLQQHQGHVEEL
jgi:hypothetical protein